MKRININLPEKMEKDLRDYCSENMIGVQELIRHLLKTEIYKGPIKKDVINPALFQVPLSERPLLKKARELQEKKKVDNLYRKRGEMNVDDYF